MKLLVGLFLIVSGIAASLVLRDGHDLVEVPDPVVLTAPGGNGPVLVELFTSEGCSSCPPADNLLSKLEQQSISGVEIIALGEHVDYWNNLGWRDPYSSSDFSKRQNSYAKDLGTNSVYTPQMIVDGTEEFVGSNESKAHSAILRAAKSPKGNIEIRLDNNSTQSQNSVTLAVTVKDLPRRESEDFSEVLLAVTENNLSSEVSRGENAGRSLKHTAVVRQLIVVDSVPAGETDFHKNITVPLATDWKKSQLHFNVFVQEQRTRQVLAAGTLGLGSQ